MTEKYEIEDIGNMFRVLKDGEPLTTKFENWDRIDVINLVEELNVLNDENKALIKVNNQLTEILSYIGLKTDEALKLLYKR